MLTLDLDISGLDNNLDPLRDLEQFLGMAVAQLLALIALVQVSRSGHISGIWQRPARFSDDGKGFSRYRSGNRRTCTSS